jgi:hypothetical protein
LVPTILAFSRVIQATTGDYHISVVADAIALVYVFHELGYGLSLLGIAAILPQLRLLTQQYFDIGG